MALASVANAMNYLMMIKQTVYAVRRFLGCCGGIAVNDRRVCGVGVQIITTKCT